MFLELIATFVAGFAGAGLMMLVVKLSGGRLPRWSVPVAAGLAMLAATIGSEYSWYPRTEASLPEGMVVAQTVEETAIYRPWTYVWPFTTRFMAVDAATIKTNETERSQRLADLYFFGRWSPVRVVEVMVDCETGAHAGPQSGASAEPKWRIVGPDDPLVAAVCKGGA